MISLIAKSLLAALLIAGTLPLAKGNDMPPVYQRGRGHHHGNYPWHYPGGYPFNYGFFGFPPQFYAGSWYQRPYPTHLDYFRLQAPAPMPPYGYPCVENEVLEQAPSE